MRLLKNKSGKVGIAANMNPYAQSPDMKANSALNPFNNRMDAGYNKYVGQLEHGEMKNNS